MDWPLIPSLYVSYFRDSNINDQLIIKMQQLQISLLSIALID